MTLLVEAKKDGQQELKLPRLRVIDDTPIEAIDITGKGFCHKYRKDRSLTLDLTSQPGQVIIKVSGRDGISEKATYDSQQVTVEPFYPLLRTGHFENTDLRHPYPSCVSFNGQRVKLTAITVQVGDTPLYYDNLREITADQDDNILKLLLNNNQTAIIQLNRIKACNLRYAEPRTNTFVDVSV